VSLGFFGANDSYWQIRYQRDAQGGRRRVIVAYKKDYSADPAYRSSNPFIRRHTTGLWRLPLVGRPEQLMTGEMYAGNLGSDSRDTSFVVAHAYCWAYARTSATKGERVPRLVGTEFDEISDSYPHPKESEHEVIGHSPVGGTVSDASLYVAPSGAVVFDAGTISWDWGLDNIGQHDRVSPLIQQVTSNLLHRFEGG
jgi:hypothetical protein